VAAATLAWWPARLHGNPQTFRQGHFGGRHGIAAGLRRLGSQGAVGNDENSRQQQGVAFASSEKPKEILFHGAGLEGGMGAPRLRTLPLFRSPERMPGGRGVAALVKSVRPCRFCKDMSVNAQKCFLPREGKSASAACIDG
jgi:hypothetical protein